MTSHIIDDSSTLILPDGMSTGYRGMYSSAATLGDISTLFPPELLMTDEEIRDISNDQWNRKATLYHLILEAGWRCKNQGEIPYCWTFSSVSSQEHNAIIQNQKHIPLSPASVGGPVTGYKRRGGYGQESMEYQVNHGVVPTSMWADTAIDKRLDTPESRAERQYHKVSEWMVLPGRSFRHVASCVLRHMSVSGGFAFWQHQVSIVAINPEGSVIIANSWGNWGDNGFGELKGGRRVPDDAVVPRVTTAS